MSSNSGSAVSCATRDGANPVGVASANRYDLLAPESAKLTGTLTGHARVPTSGQILDRQTRTHHRKRLGPRKISNHARRTPITPAAPPTTNYGPGGGDGQDLAVQFAQLRDQFLVRGGFGPSASSKARVRQGSFFRRTGRAACIVWPAPEFVRGPDAFGRAGTLASGHGTDVTEGDDSDETNGYEPDGPS